MTALIDVPANEIGLIRLFSLSMTEQEARRLKSDPRGIQTVLGANLDTEQVEVFPVSDLESVGLTGYLQEGNAVPADQIAPDRAKLDRLGGWVLIVFSRAFDGKATTLRPAAALTLIGTYGETRTDWRATQTVTSEAAKPFTAPPETVKKRPSDAAMSGRIAMIVLIGLGLFTWAIIWIAG